MRNRHAAPPTNSGGRRDAGVDSGSNASGAGLLSQSDSLSGADGGRHVAVRQRPRSLEEMYNSYTYFLSTLYLRVMDSLPGFVQSFALSQPMPPQWAVMLGRLGTYHVRPYDGANPEHVHILKQLWVAHNKVMFRGDVPFVPIDPTWKEMGFQGTDPAKDFRGGGRLSLEQLVYMAEKHPADWNRMLDGDYLLAAAGINVSLRLMSLMEIGDGKIVGPSTAALAHTQFTMAKAREQICRFIFDENINAVFTKLNEVYCAIMRLVFRRWQESARNIMEFNSILTRVYGEVERLLYVCESLDEFSRLLS